MGDKVCIEQHVENSSGHGVPSFSEGRARIFFERDFPRWGKSSVAAKTNIGRTHFYIKQEMPLVPLIRDQWHHGSLKKRFWLPGLRSWPGLDFLKVFL